MSKSLYDTLEISQDASADEIKKSYRRLARKYHPDINKESGAEEKFKEINAAYEILSDEKKRRQYDQFGDAMFGGQNFHDFARAQGGVSLDELIKQVFGEFSARASGGFNAGGFRGFSGGFDFNSFQQTEEMLDINAQVTIPFTTAILGGKHHVSISGQELDIKVPAGIRDGERIRLRGKGRSVGGQVGDMLLKVIIAAQPDYVLEGDDLKKRLDIPLKTALFGGKIEVETLHKTITLKIPQNTKNHQKFRIKELGAYNRKTKSTGDLYLEANIILPDVDSLPKELKESMEKYL
ncbi:MAG: J domain-containing protein [Helicobacteraceae bacterium]|nr:J domain-containing protein [Helicobacteraceae bacterium]